MFECVIPLPDALIRKPMDESSKSIKHGDHDQSDHGSWAHGGASDRSAGNVSKYIQAHGLKTTVSDGSVVGARDKEKAMWKLEKDTRNNSTLPTDHRNDTPEMRAVRSQEKQVELAATILAQGYKAMREVPTDNWKVIEVFAPDGSLAAAAMGTLQEQYDGGTAFAMRFFGSLGTVEGAGTAIMARSLEMAADANAEYRLIKVQSGSHEWYQQWGFDTLDTSGKADMSREQVADWVAKYRASTTKSLKHGDHDQSDHGNWADGSGDGSKENPIRTNSVEDAARALGEGKHVELRTPDQVATLLDRLNELAKEAEAAGTKAKNIDLCQLTVPGTNLFCVESKGIPRVEMPQLKGIPNSGSAASDLTPDKRGEVDITEAYLERLRSSGVVLTEDEALASHLKATQNELNGGKVAGIMQAARAGELDLNQPIVVSKDGYIVDGHHRWAAKVALEHDGIDDPETDMKIPVVRVDQDILEILESSKQFAADMGLPQMAVKSLKHADHDQSEHGNWATGNAEKTGPQAWLGITKLSDVPKYKIGSPSEASEPQVAARIATNIAEFKAAGGVVTRLPILPNAGVTGSYSYAETPEQEATSDWVFREAESARASADEYELRAQDASSQEEQDRLLAIASGYSHMATALDRASGSGTFIATTGGERGTIVGVLAGSFNSGEWEGTMFGSSQSVAGTGSALMYAAIEAVADADRVSRLAITFPEPESLPFYRAFGLTPEIGTWESKPNPSGLILARGSAVRIDQAVSGMTPESIVAQYGLTKSMKHGDHDQSDHGNWAHGSAPRPTLSAEDKSKAEEALLKNNGGWKGGNYQHAFKLTDLEVAAATHYKGFGYMEMNNLLRGVGSDWGMAFVPEVVRGAELLESAMKKTSLQTDIKLYRGMHIPSDDAEKFLSTLKPGAVYTDPAFVSTSKSEKVALGFALDRAPDDRAEDRTSIIWEMFAPAGTSAMDFDKLFTSTGATEKEVLLASDTHLRILGTQREGFTSHGEPIVRVTATVIPTGTPPVKHADHDQSEHGNWANGERYTAEARNNAERALTHYSIDGYQRINSYLRKTDMSQDEWQTQEFDPKPAIKEIDSLFESAAPLKEPVTVFRGIDSELAEKMTWKQGDTYTDAAFMSTSLREEVSERFTDYGGKGAYIMQIEVPAGTTALTPSMFATLVDEDEVLLNRGTELQITGTELKDNFNYIYATVVPSTKSFKHADHDQSDHGNWATGRITGAKIPIEQVDALRSWSSNSYNMINGALRNPDTLGSQERGGLREPVQKMQDQLDKLFAGVPKTTEEMTVFRGATGDWVKDLVDRYEATIDKMRAGYRETGEVQQFIRDRFTDLGFTSTTPDRDIAIRFSGTDASSGGVYTGEGRAIFEINIPEGSSVVNVEEFVNEFGGFTKFAAEEKEYLLPRGSTFEVADVTPSEEQFGSQGPLYYTIRLDLVPSSTKSLKHADHDQSEHGNWAEKRDQIEREDAERAKNDPWKDSPVSRSDAYASMAHYADFGYIPINRFLRGSDGDRPFSTKDKILQDVKNIDAMFTVATPLAEDLKVFRGVSYEQGSEMIAGRIFTDAGYTSTSRNAITPFGFMDETAGRQYMMEITVPAGSKVAQVELSNEAETLLPRGSQFMITGLRNDGITIVEATLINSLKSYKHADHDQSDHGSWATGESAETKFSEDENGAITIYTDQGHMSINGYLRGSRYGGDDQYVPKWVANLDSAIESAGPTTRNMTIYRGISQRHLQELIDGGVLQDAGFASFTKDGETAAGFATGGSVGIRRSDGAVLELDLPAGSAALDMKDAGIPNEQEVLLPRGSRFELISGPEELDLSNDEDNENNRLPVYQIRLVSPTKSLKHGDHDQEDHGNWARGFDAPSSSVPTPAGSKTTVPLWWHERDQTVSLDNMRNGMEASVREALDAYTHWSADDGYETGTRLAFHAALNERLRAGDSRFKAVEAVARLFAEADDEELVAKLGRGFMDIDNALRDSKVKEDMMVTRASSPIMSIQELEAAAKGESINIYGQEIAPGAVYSDAGIISTSADMTYQSTQFFAQNWDSPEGLEDWQVPTTVRWNINLPSGAPALDLRALGFASQHGEDEVLLPRNTHFRIDGVDVQLPPMDGGSAKVTVSATVIPTHSTTKP